MFGEGLGQTRETSYQRLTGHTRLHGETDIVISNLQQAVRKCFGLWLAGGSGGVSFVLREIHKPLLAFGRGRERPIQNQSSPDWGGMGKEILGFRGPGAATQAVKRWAAGSRKIHG